ncbi:MAG: MFS transporter [Hyphomonadaceae bacterium]|nr:MFS transporter [Hyphomonadaceae bacterium]
MTEPDIDPDVPLRPLTPFQQGMIAFASVAMGAGMTINFVVVAPLARKAGLTETQVAGILTLSALIYALMIPQWGRWADRFGRKRVMVFSLMAMGFTNMAFLFALEAALAGMITGLTMFFTLVFVRVWFGLLSPGLQPASMAAMTDATTPKTRAAGLGMLGAAMSIGSIIGPAGATVLAPFGALVPLWGSIVFNITCGILIAFALPKSRSTRQSAQRPTPLAMRDPRVLPHLMFLFTYFVGVGMIQQTLGWFIEDRYDLGEERTVLFTGIAFACLAVMMVIIQFGYVQPRKPDPRRMLPVGLFLVAIGYVLANLLMPFWAICIAFLIVGGGAALAVPAANALGSLSVERREQGSAAALLAAAPPAGFIFGPLIGATLYQVSAALPLYLSAVLMTALGAYAALVVARRPLGGG